MGMSLAAAQANLHPLKLLRILLLSNSTEQCRPLPCIRLHPTLKSAKLGQQERRKDLLLPQHRNWTVRTARRLWPFISRRRALRRQQRRFPVVTEAFRLRSVPDYKILAIMAFICNPLLGIIVFYFNAAAKHEIIWGERYKAHRLYQATIALGVFSIGLTAIVVAELIIWTTMTPNISPDACVLDWESVKTPLNQNGDLKCFLRRQP